MNVLGIDVNRPPKRAKATYAILKDSLDKTLAEMEQWQKRFDPSWYLVLRLQDRRVDRKLQDAPWKSKVMKTATNVRDVIASNTRRPATQIFLPENDLQSATIGQLAFTTARTMRRTPLSRLHIIDTIQCGTGVMYDHRRKGIRDFARKLNAAEPSELALLNCTGVVARKDGYQYELIFQLPDGMTDPRSLRYCLDSGVSRYSLSDRMQLATQLATAVCSVHTFGFVHKNIRPENIIVLRTRGSTMGSAFLLGFTEVRLETGFTQLIGSSRWEEDLYRHPQRQGHRIKDRYIMQHDIYSLGVCLLELGLGSPFVRYSVGANGYEEAKPATYTFGKHHRPGMEKGEAIQKELVALTKQSLAISMGNKYANIVLTCLTCLDKNNENFGEESEFQDDDGVLVAVRYIEKVSLIRYEEPTAAHIIRSWQS